MRRALSRIPRLSLSSHSDSLPPLPPLPSASLPPPRRRRYFTFGSRAAEIPCGFVKRASLGCCRGSRFAAGFTPLQPKALGSIIDLGRAENCSPDDLVSVWDDVRALPETLAYFSCYRSCYPVFIITSLLVILSKRQTSEMQCRSHLFVRSHSVGSKRQLISFFANQTLKIYNPRPDFWSVGYKKNLQNKTLI